MNDYRMGRRSRAAHVLLRSQGLGFVERPGSDLPEMPRDIAELGDEDLMALYSQVVAWSDYSGAQLACAVVDERDLARRADSAERMAQLNARAQGSNVTDARLAAKEDQEVEAANEALFEAEAYRKLLEHVVESCDKNAALVSRELTRRVGGSGERSRRGSSWTL